MQGAKPFSSTLMRCALSASQWASRPSPSEVARPMPVIQTSAVARPEDVVSVIGDNLLRKADTLSLGIHVSTQIRVREGNVAECECRVELEFAADPDLRFGHRITRAFVKDVGVNRQ